MRECLLAHVNVTIAKVSVRSGRLREVVRVHNLVTNIGLDQLRDALAGDPVTFPTHIALGTGSTGPSSGDSALEAEVYRDAITQVTRPATGHVRYRQYLSSQDANGHALAEAGLFNAAVAGVLYARVTFPADEKTNAEAWTLTWDVEVANA